MTTKKHILVFMTAVITMVTGMLSCEYKDLDEYDYSSPSFILNLNCDRVDSIPDKYLVVFYPMDGQGYYAREISGQSAVINNIPAGQYKVTAWNKYLEHTRVDIDADRNKTVAYAYPYFTTTELPIKVLDSLYNGQTIYDVPDYMVHANTEFFELYKATENQELTMQADSMVITVELRLHGIASLSLAKQVKATVNNVARYRFPAFDNCTKDTCTVMFDCLFNAADSLVYADFNVFGIEPDGSDGLPHLMVLFFWLNGNNIYLPIDVTEAFLMARKGGGRIVIDVPDLGIDLKDYIPASGTFDIDIGKWEDVNIEISW